MLELILLLLIHILLADGRTGLMLACVKGFGEAALLLLEAGAQPNSKDAFGGTAM